VPPTDQTTLTLTMRPNTFAEVIGLEKVIATVKTKLDVGAVPRAFLIQGPYGCGKTTLAHIIAKAIQGPFFEGKPQVQEVNAANYRKIESMRTLAESAGSYPFIGTYSVIILDECHKLTGDSQDILLKELEVPVSPTVWILCTTNPEELNEGVRDRCFQLAVEGMGVSQRHELIARAVKETGYTASIEEFEALISKTHITSPRKILMAFDEVVAGRAVAEAVALHALAITPEYFQLAFAVCFKPWNEAATLLKDFEDRLKKKPAAGAGVEDESIVDDDDLDTKPEAAKALRAVIGAMLKNRVLPKRKKDGTCVYPTLANADKASRAMQALARNIPGDVFELQWSGLIVTLFAVNKIMCER
jgi:hypothetical protein